MRIVGIGTDIVECLRIGRMIEQHGEMFLQRAYTRRETTYCRARRRSIEHFAGLWAAKEAALKCLGAGNRKGLRWTDLEIRIDPTGTPRLHLCGAARDRALELQITDVMLSISHCRAYATAYAVALADPLTPFPSPAGGPGGEG